MDCKKLISAIEERRSLWDPRHSQHHNRVINRRMWSEIGSLLNTTSASVKLKWQRLKDTHRREVRKSNFQFNSKWKHFEHMKFLEDTYVTRAPVKNSFKSPQEDTGKDTTVVIDPDDQHSEIYEDEFEQLTSLPQKRSSEPVRDPFEDIVQLEGANVEHFQKISARNDRVIEEDEDYCFLMSILPHLRAIPQNKKLQTRIRLQQVLIEEKKAVEPNFNSSALVTPSLDNNVCKDTMRVNGVYDVCKNREELEA